MVFSLDHSWQNVGRGDSGAERTGWNLSDFFDGINTSRWAGGDFTLAIELDVRRQVVGIVDGVAVCLAVFQSKLIRSSINLAQIVDAGFCGSGTPGIMMILINFIKNEDNKSGAKTTNRQTDQGVGFF